MGVWREIEWDGGVVLFSWVRGVEAPNGETDCMHAVGYLSGIFSSPRWNFRTE